jgi:hypothetical protein
MELLYNVQPAFISVQFEYNVFGLMAASEQASKTLTSLTPLFPNVPILAVAQVTQSVKV